MGIEVIAVITDIKTKVITDIKSKATISITLVVKFANNEISSAVD